MNHFGWQIRMWFRRWKLCCLIETYPAVYFQYLRIICNFLSSVVQAEGVKSKRVLPLRTVWHWFYADAMRFSHKSPDHLICSLIGKYPYAMCCVANAIRIRQTANGTIQYWNRNECSQCCEAEPQQMPYHKLRTFFHRRLCTCSFTAQARLWIEKTLSSEWYFSRSQERARVCVLICLCLN